MKDISLGHCVLIICKYKLDYSKTYFSEDNLINMMTLHDIIDSNVKLSGYIDKNGETYIEDNSETANLLDRLDRAFDRKDVYNQMIFELEYHELYEILAEMKKPLTIEGQRIIEELSTQ